MSLGLNRTRFDLTRSSSTQLCSPSEKREQQFQILLSQQIIDLNRIRSMSWAGVPDKFRNEVWRLFLDYQPINSTLKESTLRHKRNDYFDCLERVYSEPQRQFWTNAQHQTVGQILKDLPRTKLALRRNSRVMLLFERVLFVWAVRHPASGYVQGMDDLLQPFFFAFLMPYFPNVPNVTALAQLENIDSVPEEVLRDIEADCFWCFSKLLDGLQDLYTRDQPGLYKMMATLQGVIERVDPELHAHIEAEEIQYHEFAFRWINCLLVREFPPHILFRLWDSYLCYHARIASTHVYVCAALMTHLSMKLIPLPRAEFVMFIQSIDKIPWTFEEIDTIIAQAYVYEKMFYSAMSHLRSASMPVIHT